MTSFPHLRISTSGRAEILHVPCVKPQPHSGTSSLKWNEPLSRQVHLEAQPGARDQKNTNVTPPRTLCTVPMPSFIQAGEQGQRKPPSLTRNGLWEGGRDWKMLSDSGQKLTIPTDIVTSTLWPDLVLWSTTLRTVYLIELTVPWEDATDIIATSTVTLLKQLEKLGQALHRTIKEISGITEHQARYIIIKNNCVIYQILTEYTHKPTRR